MDNKQNKVREATSKPELDDSLSVTSAKTVTLVCKHICSCITGSTSRKVSFSRHHAADVPAFWDSFVRPLERRLGCPGIHLVVPAISTSGHVFLIKWLSIWIRKNLKYECAWTYSRIKEYCNKLIQHISPLLEHARDPATRFRRRHCHNCAPRNPV